MPHKMSSQCSHLQTQQPWVRETKLVGDLCLLRPAYGKTAINKTEQQVGWPQGLRR